MYTNPEKSRERFINKLRRRLSRCGSPRCEMALIVCATGAAGFVASAGMLFLGLQQMSLRYALAVGIAYLVFLFFVWIWLRAKRESLDKDLDVDVGEVLDAIPDMSGSGGGETSIADAAGLGGEEVVVVLVVLLAILSAVVAAVYFVVIAPAFFAEVLLDSALSYGLYRRLRGIEPRHWLESAFSKTVIPFAIVTVFFAIAGAVMHAYAPEADSIGDVWNQMFGGETK